MHGTRSVHGGGSVSGDGTNVPGFLLAPPPIPNKLQLVRLFDRTWSYEVSGGWLREQGFVGQSIRFALFFWNGIGA